MFVFNKNYVLNSSNSWFASKLDNNFNLTIDEKKSIVIFGYNGIGKSSIFKCIKSVNDSSISFLDYEFKDDKRFTGKILEISVDINQITDNQNIIDSINKDLDASSILKEKYGVTKKGDASKISDDLAKVRQNKKIPVFNHRNEFKSYIDAHPNLEAKILFEVWGELSNVVNAQVELDNDMANKKYIAIKKAYELMSDDTCPICDVNTPGLKLSLEAKISELENQKSILIEKMEKYISVDNNIINDYVNAYNDMALNTDILVEYFICGGELDVYDSIATKLNQRETLINQNNSLIQNALNIYNAVKSQESKLKKDFKRYFGISDADIIFDDANYKVKISFSRDIKTYSTGEINLMSFLFHIYSFIGSDKKTLILDDPASSLDLINHYKIAYEIVRNSRTKNMVVLTHSVDFVNIINSQRKGAFDFYYLEECNNLLHINKINCTNNNESNIISLNQLYNNDDFVRVLNERESALIHGSNANVEVFHYTINEKFIDDDSTKLSNYKLADLIDNFTSFSLSDFYSNSLIKIKYLCALRVWIEKKLYELIPSTDPNKNTFLGIPELGQKIEKILPSNNSNPYNVSFTREDLMSKKVMLNQGIHYHSKVMPMAYAINISFDQLAKEINEIKQLF